MMHPVQEVKIDVMSEAGPSIGYPSTVAAAAFMISCSVHVSSPPSRLYVAQVSENMRRSVNNLARNVRSCGKMALF
jgi:hypothetical protein